VTASAHGDEKGGSIAIQSIAKQIRSGKREITNGRLVLLPKVNPRAYKEGKRFIDEDINRYMLPGYPRSGYEGKIRPALIDLIDEFSKNADPNFKHYALDLHSFHAPNGVPYPITFSKDGPDHDFAKALEFPRIISGWYDAYLNSDPEDLIAHGLKPKNVAAFATVIGKRAHDNGAIALGVECGPHEHHNTAQRAYKAIDTTLNYAGISSVLRRTAWRLTRPDTIADLVAATSIGGVGGVAVPQAEKVQALKVLFKRSTDEAFHIDVRNDCERLQPNQLILSGPDREVRAPDLDLDWRLLLAKPNPKAGDYVGYLSVKTDEYINPATLGL